LPDLEWMTRFPTLTTSSGPALSPMCATFPLIVACPVAISSSISRREPSPAWASNFCNFCVSGPDSRRSFRPSITGVFFLPDVIVSADPGGLDDCAGLADWSVLRAGGDRNDAGVPSARRRGDFCDLADLDCIAALLNRRDLAFIRTSLSALAPTRAGKRPCQPKAVLTLPGDE
jgi:hypothetical protein